MCLATDIDRLFATHAPHWTGRIAIIPACQGGAGDVLDAARAALKIEFADRIGLPPDACARAELQVDAAALDRVFAVHRRTYVQLAKRILGPRYADEADAVVNGVQMSLRGCILERGSEPWLFNGAKGYLWKCVRNASGKTGTKQGKRDQRFGRSLPTDEDGRPIEKGTLEGFSPLDVEWLCREQRIAVEAFGSLEEEDRRRLTWYHREGRKGVELAVLENVLRHAAMHRLHTSEERLARAFLQRGGDPDLTSSPYLFKLPFSNLDELDRNEGARS
ncbi:MAG: hypothetical protein H6834_10225 [Planctomycetes bacterium]|nr:hypothetical protein [Planctomycetota bacterium]